MVLQLTVLNDSEIKSTKFAIEYISFKLKKEVANITYYHEFDVKNIEIKEGESIVIT